MATPIVIPVSPRSHGHHGTVRFFRRSASLLSLSNSKFDVGRSMLDVNLFNAPTYVIPAKAEIQVST